MQDLPLQNCAYLGGCNYPIAAGDAVTIIFRDSDALIKLADGSSFIVPNVEISSVDISGPGAISTGGGFVGGGFGAAGAIEGIAVATVLNALTTKSKIHTFISITTNIGEIHFHYGGMEPNALRIALAPLFAALRMLNPVWREQRLDILRLAQTKGLLSDSEFTRLSLRLDKYTREEGLPPPVSSDFSKLPKIVGPKGRCPNCGATVALNAEECFSCKAMFESHSAWRVIPL